MAPADIKAEFNKAIANVTEAQKVAELELLREYFTNPQFKANLQEFTAKINGAA